MKKAGLRAAYKDVRIVPSPKAGRYGLSLMITKPCRRGKCAIFMKTDEFLKLVCVSLKNTISCYGIGQNVLLTEK
jgi:hypothetical protein